MKHDASLALIKFLSDLAKQLGVSRHIYVVGGAVRNFVMDSTGLKYPVKDIDCVIDSVALHGKDSMWFAEQVARAIPVQTNITTNQYGVALLHISGDWMLGDANLQGTDIEIANARTESYTEGGYTPDTVEKATIYDDVHRREFTFNTLLWRLHDLAEGPDKAEILDLTGCGLKDLKDGVMKCPTSPDKTFTDDPTRMIRAVKFLVKYGFTISLDVKRSIEKNKDKLKKVPHSHLSNMLINTFLREPTGKKALLEMQKLGLLDVIKEIVQTQKPFREALANWADKEATVEFLFDLMDLGLPHGKRLSFLPAAQQQEVREVTVGMTHTESEFFIQVLAQPGKVIDTKALMLEFNLKGANVRQIQDVARAVLIHTPELMSNPALLTSRVRIGLQPQVRVGGTPAKAAKAFELNTGDPVLFGKFLNKPGTIQNFGKNDKGDPTVVIDPLHGGPPKELKLFKLRYDEGRATQDPVTRLAYRYLHVARNQVFRQKLANPAMLQEYPARLKELREAVARARMLGHKTNTSVWLAWFQFYRTGKEWAAYVIDHLALPPKSAKAVEMAVRLFSKSYGSGKGPPDIPKWFDENEARLVLLEQARFWSERSDETGVFPLGPFTVHDTIQASPKDLANAKDIIAHAVKAAHSSGLPGFGSMVYGQLFLVGQLARKNWAAWYMPAKDHIYLRPGVRGSSNDESARHLVHELGHRYWSKKVDRGTKAAWVSHHTTMTWTKPNRRLPEVGEVLVPLVNSKKVRVESYDERGQAILVDVATGSSVGTVNRLQLSDWVQGAAHKMSFPTLYAATDAEEHFCESLSLYAFGMLTGDNLLAFEKVILGVAPQSVARVAAKYKDKKTIKTQDGDEAVVYEYSEKQIQHRNREKAERIEKLRGNLHKLQARVTKDLKSDNMHTRLCALAVGLMNDTYERVGNDESAKDGHVGVTGWSPEHIKFSGGKATITYVGKSGVKQEKVTKDADLIRVMKEAVKDKKKGDTIFSHDDGKVDASAVNEYLDELDLGITAKDIRGLHANREMQERLKVVRSKGGKLPEDKKKREKTLKDEFKEALEGAAEAVGHESATLKSQYLVPGLEDAYLKDGTVQTKLDKKGYLVADQVPSVPDAQALIKLPQGNRNTAVWSVTKLSPLEDRVARRVAARYLASQHVEAGLGRWLAWIVRPFKVILKHHKEFVSGPVDDAVDAIIKELAPKLVLTLREQEVDEAVGGFMDGAMLGHGDALNGRSGDIYQVKGMHQEAGYAWGFTHSKDWDGKVLPDGMRRQVIKDVLGAFSRRITEEVLLNLLKKTWHAINPVNTVKAILVAVKKHGWKLGVGFALFEVFEHFLLPALLAAVTGNKNLLSLAALPIGEVIYAIVFRVLGRTPSEVNKADEAGHLDWYEQQYGPVRLGTKTPAQKEDKDVRQMLKPDPKKKPAREDLRRNRMRTEDADVGGTGAGGDRDLSLNYKKIAARIANRWVLHLVASGHRRAKSKKKSLKPSKSHAAGDSEHKPGEVWKTEEGNWSAKNKKGEPQSFGDGEDAKTQAEAYAKGSTSTDSPEGAGKDYSRALRVMTDALTSGYGQRIERAKKKLLEEHPELGTDLDKYLKAYEEATKEVTEARKGLHPGLTGDEKTKQEKAFSEATAKRDGAIEEIRNLGTDSPADSPAEAPADSPAEAPTDSPAAPKPPKPPKSKGSLGKTIEIQRDKLEAHLSGVLERLPKKTADKLRKVMGQAESSPELIAAEAQVEEAQAEVDRIESEIDQDVADELRQAVYDAKLENDDEGAKKAQKELDELEKPLKAAQSKLGIASKEVQRLKRQETKAFTEAKTKFFNDVAAALDGAEDTAVEALANGVTAEMIKEADRDPFKKVDWDDPASIAKALVQQAVKDNVLLNPAYVGGKGLSASPLNENALTDRAEAAFNQYRRVKKEARVKAAENAAAQLAEMDPDSPQAKELNRIIDGIHAAMEMNGEKFEAKDAEGNLLREPLNEKMGMLFRQMVNQGDVRHLLADTHDNPKVRESVRDALGRLGDGELAELSKDTPWAPIGDLLSGLGGMTLDPEVAELLRGLVRDMSTNNMTTNQGLVNALAGKKMPSSNPLEVYADFNKRFKDKVGEALEGASSSWIDCIMEAKDATSCDVGGMAQQHVEAMAAALDEIAKETETELDPQNPVVAAVRHAAKTGDRTILDAALKPEKTPSQRKQEFMEKMTDPAERERVQKMSPDEFDEMEKAILGGEGAPSVT